MEMSGEGMRQRRQKKEGTGGTVEGKNIICEEKYERKLGNEAEKTEERRNGRNCKREEYHL